MNYPLVTCVPGRASTSRHAGLIGSRRRLVEFLRRDDLARGRGASRHTLLAYRDALRLLLRFVAGTTKGPVAELRLADLPSTA